MAKYCHIMRKEIDSNDKMCELCDKCTPYRPDEFSQILKIFNKITKGENKK